MKVKLKVKLSKPVSGQAIAKAVKRIAKDNFKQKTLVVTDETTSYLVGQDNVYTYGGVVIGTGPNTIPELVMETIYVDEVYVLSWKFDDNGAVFRCAAGHLSNDEEIIKVVREFRDKLQVLL